MQILQKDFEKLKIVQCIVLDFEICKIEISWKSNFMVYLIYQCAWNYANIINCVYFNYVMCLDILQSRLKKPPVILSMCGEVLVHLEHLKVNFSIWL